MKKIHFGDLATVTYQMLENGDIRLNSILVGNTELLSRAEQPFSNAGQTEQRVASVPETTVLNVTSTTNLSTPDIAPPVRTSMSETPSSPVNYQQPPDEFISIPVTGLPGAPSGPPDLGQTSHLGSTPAGSIQDVALQPGRWETPGIDPVPQPVSAPVVNQPTLQPAPITALDPVQHAAMQTSFRIAKTSQQPVLPVEHVSHTEAADISKLHPATIQKINEAWGRTTVLDHAGLLAKLTDAYDGQLPAIARQLDFGSLRVFAYNTIVRMNQS